MIRRDVTSENGQPAWLLISQVEHARLSGELAEQWQRGAAASASTFLPLVAREELLPAIYHHDDGWQQWGKSPQVDPETGRPLAFTEMPLAVALDIWRGSIDRAREIGPLAAWVVTSHFTTLLSHSHEAKESLAVSWLEEFDRLRGQWLEAWNGIDPGRHSKQQAETALHQLQLFDLLSLWLCMAERTEPQEFEVPSGTKLKLSPLNDSPKIELSPWPLTTRELTISVTGRVVPAQPYASSAELAAVPDALHSLTWLLVPGSQSS